MCYTTNANIAAHKYLPLYQISLCISEMAKARSKVKVECYSGVEGRHVTSAVEQNYGVLILQCFDLLTLLVNLIIAPALGMTIEISNCHDVSWLKLY